MLQHHSYARSLMYPDAVASNWAPIPHECYIVARARGCSRKIDAVYPKCDLLSHSLNMAIALAKIDWVQASYSPRRTPPGHSISVAGHLNSRNVRQIKALDLC